MDVSCVAQCAWKGRDAIFWFAILFAYLALNVFLGIKFYRFIRECLYDRLPAWAFFLAQGVLMVAFVCSMFLHGGTWPRIIATVGGWYMGAFFYALLGLLLVQLVHAVLRLTGAVTKAQWKSVRLRRLVGLTLCACVAAVSIFGAVMARSPYVRKEQVTVDKPLAGHSQLRVVLVSDLHLGLQMGAGEMEDMAARINALSPDIVCIAGDLFDGSMHKVADVPAVEQAFTKIHSRYGVYACLGNHDSGDTQSEMVAFCERVGVTLLQDETVEVEGLTIAGRKDASPIGERNASRLSMQQLLYTADKGAPILMLDHQPASVQEAVENGVDLLLCGHTHRGQMFPINLITHSMFPIDWGVLRTGETTTVVSSGFGFWGPAMRVGSRAEIVQIDLQFTR